MLHSSRRQLLLPLVPNAAPFTYYCRLCSGWFCHKQATKLYLDALLPPVLHCLDDPESRVRYYACESLYNIAKVVHKTSSSSASALN